MRRKNVFRCTIMRGGTSRGIFLQEEDLPKDLQLQDRIILAIFGSPDIRQIDGLGRTDSLTSKLAIGHPSGQMDVGVEARNEGGRVYISNKVYQPSHRA